jgi:reverse transcriptase-like protein/integrase-like protein
MKRKTATSHSVEEEEDAIEETDILGEQHARSMAVSSKPPLIYNSPYLSSCAAVTSANLFALRPLMSRPAGTAFLGATASTVMCHLGTIESPPRPVLIDTGSDITLISYSVCMSLKPRPKIKTGQKVRLLQVTGLSTISGFVQLTLYFDTIDGPVSMPIEAYVVKGMNSDFILGNDFGDQYQLSITRDEHGSKLILGESKRCISLSNAVISSDETPVRATRSQQAANHVSGKTRTITSDPKPKVRAVSDVVIPPHTVKFVEIETKFPTGLSEAYIESIELVQENLEGSLQIIEAIIPSERCSILVSNTSRKPLKLSRGEVLGELRDPRTWLNIYDSTNSDSQELISASSSVRSFLSSLTRPPAIDPEEPQHEYVADVIGGPKTAETPDTTLVPSFRLLEEVNFNPQLTKEQQIALGTIVTRRSKAFGLDGRLGTHPARVEIKLKPGSEPVSMRPYAASPMKREVIDEQLDVWISAGVIEPSKSPWGFPVLIVFRNNKPRLCVDYRKLNEMTIPDEYPLPKQTDILQALSGSQWLSTFDALSGFTQLEIAQEDRHLTAFRTHRGLHQFKRLPFGLRNGPSVFQRVMNEILSRFLWIFVLVYIDDIVVYSLTFEDHLKHIDWVLRAIEEAGITLSPSKCYLGYQSLLLLGQKVSRLGISTHREKVDAIVALKPPKNVSELQTFLGMMVYFSNYIPFYAWIVNPLFQLLKKGTKWIWDENHQEAFEVSKQVLQSSPVLAYAQPGKGYRLYSDACDYGLAAILQQVQAVKIRDLRGTKAYARLQSAHQKGLPPPVLVTTITTSCEDPLPRRKWADEFEETFVDIERVIAYWSRVLKSAEKNYSPTEKEALALKEGLIKFQPYLEGERIVAITDHAALTWSRTFQNVNRRLLTWGVVYAAYPDLDVVHRAGRVHSNVDPISRLRRRVPFFESPSAEMIEHVELKLASVGAEQKDWQERLFERHSRRTNLARTRSSPRTAPDTITPTKEPIIDGSTRRENSEDTVVIVQPSEDDIRRYAEGYTDDPFFTELLNRLRSSTDLDHSRHKRYEISDEGLLYYLDWSDRHRLCVPKSMQNEVLTSIHDQLGEAAHAGFERTYNRLVQTFYWPGMARHTKNFVKTCDVCQKIKHHRHAPLGLIRAIPIPEKPFDVISMDFIMDLPESNGFSAILVIVDKLTKYGIFIATRKQINEVETAHLVVDRVVVPYGVPRGIITDRDSRWTGDFWKEVSTALGANRHLTTSYHPQADGQTEILNQTLEVSLRAYIDGDRSNWSSLLPQFMLSYNTTRHYATGFSPAFLLMGYQPNSLPTFLIPQGTPQNRTGFRNDSSISFLESIQAARNHAQDSITRFQDTFVDAQNSKRIPFEFEIGDQVLINPHTLRLEGPWGGKGHKLAERYEGPFEITEKYGSTTYGVRLPADYNIHSVINIEHLVPYHPSPSEFGQRTTRDIKTRTATNKEDWEVAEIVEEKFSTRKIKGRRRLLYRCKWIYPDGAERETDEWIPERDMNNAKEVLRTWKNRLVMHPELKAR